MKQVSLFFLLLLPILTFSQGIDRYLESIRNNRAQLTAFFSEMPKGGDLHHHFSGSVYAETYIRYAIEQGWYINKKTYEIRDALPADTDYVQLSQLKKPLLSFYEQKLLEKWSVKDYNGVSQPSDKLFFGSFPAFDIANKKTFDQGLQEIKARAKLENVSYIETMFTGIKCDMDLSGLESYNKDLYRLQETRNGEETQRLLESIYSGISKQDPGTCVAAFNRELTERHTRLNIDDSGFVLRYQNYVLRLIDNPVRLFKDLIVAFESADSSPLIVGVNIVGAEDDKVSMKDYWLHMQLFRFCHRKYPSVKYAMHAGELALGLVKPEELTWHINEAVRVAGANRIGHGVDMAYEKESGALLDYMREKQIPVEINLYSNEFILRVKNEDHPLVLYKNARVPIVIATDDAGVLRSNFIHQFVLLVNRYPSIRYQDVKQFVFNSIRYSFIEEPAVRKRLTEDLRKRFSVFESKAWRITAP